MSVQRTQADPCFFGPRDELFGFFHASESAARTAVLLCPPMGQELIRSHRSYRQLAESLAAKGVASLRFDYYGSGDSAGDSIELSWTRCIQDLIVATTELRARSGCERIVGFGARLGGSLVLAGASDARFAEAIVWDPIADGAAHAAQLDVLQEKLRVDRMRFTGPRSSSDAAGQWLGFPLNETWRGQIQSLAITLPDLPILLLDSSPTGSRADFDGFVAAGVSVKALGSSTHWDELDRLEHAVLSAEMVRVVTAHLTSANSPVQTS